MKTIENLIQTLNQVNWDFSDYNSAKYPLDINSIPWYPATFPTPIPKFLIGLLSEVGDIVLDPFGGKGTTAVEAIKLNRRFYYNDLNPFAVDITKAILQAIKSCNLERAAIEQIINSDKKTCVCSPRTCIENEYEGKEEEKVMANCPEYIFNDLKDLGIDKDVVFWYHIDTLIELISLFKQMLRENSDSDGCMIRKFAFVSILKQMCSQRGHFTYVTDNCRPKKLVYYNAISAYFSILERINLSSLDLIKQFSTINETGDLTSLIADSVIQSGDARRLSYVNDNSIDFVLTSPPYLCAQDYVKTMRLTNLFFPDKIFGERAPNEIGSRSKRHSNAEVVVTNFYSDMDKVFSEIERVLKPEKYFCLIIGQGKGKITESYDTIDDLTKLVINKYGFSKIFYTERKIGYKTVRVGGVDNETVIVFRKN